MVRLNILPVPKPRMTRADKWKKRPTVLRYRAFKDALRNAGVTKLPSELWVDFYLPMPKSWSAKKKASMLGPHSQRPDLDNLVKALMDAVGRDDSHVTQIHALKFWDYEGWIDMDYP